MLNTGAMTYQHRVVDLKDGSYCISDGQRKKEPRPPLGERGLSANHAECSATVNLSGTALLQQFLQIGFNQCAPSNWFAVFLAPPAFRALSPAKNSL